MADAQGNNTGAAGQAQNTARFAAPPNPLITVQDRLFHTLFFRLTLAYARGCPKPLRRIIEMMILVKVNNIDVVVHLNRIHIALRFDAR